MLPDIRYSIDDSQYGFDHAEFDDDSLLAFALSNKEPFEDTSLLRVEYSFVLSVLRSQIKDMSAFIGRVNPYTKSTIDSPNALDAYIQQRALSVVYAHRYHHLKESLQKENDERESKKRMLDAVHKTELQSLEMQKKGIEKSRNFLARLSALLFVILCAVLVFVFPRLDSTQNFISSRDISAQAAAPVESYHPIPTKAPIPTPRVTPAPTPAPLPSPSPAFGSLTESSQTVYITQTGKKYHRDGCGYLSKSKIPISLSKAKEQGYTPCSRCW